MLGKIKILSLAIRDAKARRCHLCGWLLHKWLSRNYVRFNGRTRITLQKPEYNREGGERELRREDASWVLMSLFNLQAFDFRRTEPGSLVSLVIDSLPRKEWDSFDPSNNGLSSFCVACFLILQHACIYNY